ncbi:PREDICTED: gamma-butyrobetaine dioxygenase [Tauraco erythrolophus]|uniref:gamma-butyrobetaine dioxygenase n=1 Tax=Tauraco erythrolophus TaxID=121530 RepID=UPI0005231B31|nr:PREDICTED: gamma-butyrobetaine dioxygenase [Tauraco erythrolophus]
MLKQQSASFSISSLPERQYWGSDLQLPEIPFEEIMHDDESACKWLCTLKKVGIVLLTGAAPKQGELFKLGHRIGFLRLTFYGPTWQVQDKADANNVAYTTGKLCFHTDYPVLQHPPGVQFLHCIKQTAAGGDSEVVDGFHVANKLKKQNPQAYQILSSTAVDYTDVGVDYCDFAVQCKQRIIDVDSRGQAVRINYNNATRDTVFDIPAEEVRPFYAALKEFDNLLNSAEHKFTYKLKPGDIVTFDNWRVLHGRQSYPSGSEVTRHLEGAYLEAMCQPCLLPASGHSELRLLAIPAITYEMEGAQLGSAVAKGKPRFRGIYLHQMSYSTYGCITGEGITGVILVPSAEPQSGMPQERGAVQAAVQVHGQDPARCGQVSTPASATITRTG